MFSGADGGIITPLLSFGGTPLAPSFLTGNGAHMTLWTSVLLHVIAVAANLTANIAFFIDATKTSTDALMGWAIVSVTAHTLAVVGTVVYTAFVKNTFGWPLLATLGVGLFLSALLATAKISYFHSTAPAEGLLEDFSFVSNPDSNPVPTA